MRVGAGMSFHNGHNRGGNKIDFILDVSVCVPFPHGGGTREEGGGLNCLWKKFYCFTASYLAVLLSVLLLMLFFLVEKLFK